MESTLQPHRTGLERGLATALTLGAVLMATPAFPEVRRGWAHTDGVIHLGPAQPISPATIADRAMIADVFARWGIAYDDGRTNIIRTLFSADAEFTVLNGSSNPLVSVRGRDRIVAVAQSVMAQQGDQRRHAISNVVIEQLSGDRAKAIAYGTVIVAGEPNFVGATVVYSADLAREAGVWKFTRFVIGMDHYSGTPPTGSPGTTK